MTAPPEHSGGAVFCLSLLSQSFTVLPRRRCPCRDSVKTVRRLTVVQQSFASRAYRDDAVVLRTHKLGEADRIITLLTKHHGQVRAVAKGVRRTSSRFDARLEPFMVLDLQLVSCLTLDIVTHVVAKCAYGGSIVADYSRYFFFFNDTATTE